MGDMETSTLITNNQLELEGDIPWDTLSFVIGQINYGGRVTDDWDRRCLMTILDKYVNPTILDPDYIFSPSGDYKCHPEADTATVEDWRNFVDSFPIQEALSSACCVVHMSVQEISALFLARLRRQVYNTPKSYLDLITLYLDMIVEKREEKDIGLKRLQTGGAGGKTPEDQVLEMVVDQAARVPAVLTDENAHPDSFPYNEEPKLMGSLGTCLTQEMGRFNILIKKLGSTLTQLREAIKGEVVMTGELDAMFQSMLNNQTPGLWEKVAYPSLKPLSSWFSDMILRVDFMREWIERGLPAAYWVSSFYFPQGFLTSVLQEKSRRELIPVDTLSFEFVVQDYEDPSEVEEAPAQGILIYGIFMDGAAWNYENRDLGAGIWGDVRFGTHHQLCALEGQKDRPSKVRDATLQDVRARWHIVHDGALDQLLFVHRGVHRGCRFGLDPQGSRLPYDAQ